MDSAQELKLKIVSTEVVAAIAPTREQRLSLSNFDLLIPTMDFSVFFCYKKPDSDKFTTFASVAKTLKDALTRALVDYHVLAGELVPNSAGEPELLSNNIGVDFVEAVADIKLRDLDLQDPDKTLYGKLIPKRKRGVLAVQNFKNLRFGVGYGAALRRDSGGMYFQPSNSRCILCEHVSSVMVRDGPVCRQFQVTNVLPSFDLHEWPCFKVHDFLKMNITREHFLGLKNWVEARRPDSWMPKINCRGNEDGPVMLVSSGQRFPISKVDFGWGKPTFGSYYLPWGGYVMPMPSPLENGDWVVYMYLLGKEIDTIETKAGDVLRPLTSDYLGL